MIIWRERLSISKAQMEQGENEVPEILQDGMLKISKRIP